MKKSKFLQFNWYKVLSIAFFVLLLMAPNVFAVEIPPSPSQNVNKNTPFTYHSIIALTNTAAEKIKTIGVSINKNLTTSSRNKNLTASTINANVGFIDFLGDKISSNWDSFIDVTSDYLVKFFIFNNKPQISIPSSKKADSNIKNIPVNNTNINSPIEQINLSEETEIQEPVKTPVENLKEEQLQTGPQGPRGLTGLTGPQGSRGEAGRDGNMADTSSFVLKSFLTGQVNRIFDSISNGIDGLSSSLAEEVDTDLLNVSGNATIGGNMTIIGNIIGNVIGVINPSFSLGSIPFQGASNLTEDNANLFWDAANSRLGLGTTNPNDILNIAGTSKYLRFSTDTNQQPDIYYTRMGEVWDEDNSFRIYTGANQIFGTNYTGSKIFLGISGGNVGIGTTNPLNKLDVVGNIGVNGSLNSDKFISMAPYGSTSPGGSNNYLQSGADGFNLVSDASSTKINLKTWNGGSVQTNLTIVGTTGNVGIGTTNPLGKLDVNGEIWMRNYGFQIRNDADDNFEARSVTNTDMGGFTKPWYMQSNNRAILMDGEQGIAFRTYSGAWNEIMRITTGGFIGIGTTSPSQKLEVQGSIVTNKSSIIGFRNGGNTDVAASMSTDAVGHLYFNTGTASKALTILTDSGYVGIGTTVPTTSLQIGAGTLKGIAVGADYPSWMGDGGIYATGALYLGTGVTVGSGFNLAWGDSTTRIVGNSTSDDLFFVTNNIEKLRINSAGKVGIGTTSPGATLHVTDSGFGTSRMRIGYKNTEPAYYGEFGDIGIDGGGLSIDSVAGDNNAGAGIVFRRSIDSGSNFTESMRINNLGYVGIGTTAPGSILDIVGSGSNSIKLQSTTTSNVGLFTEYIRQGATSWRAGNNNGNYQIQHSTTSFTSSSTVLDIDSLRNFNFNSGQIYLSQSSGNVGIGTTSPTANLQVTQGTAGTGTVTVSGTAVTGVGTKFTNTFKVGDTITVTTTSGSETKAITTITSDTVLVTAAFTGTAAAGTAYTLVGGDRFVVKGNGNIGIGTTAPTAKIHVYQNDGNVLISKLESPTSNSYISQQWINDSGYGEIWRNSSARNNGSSENLSLNIYNSNGPISFWANGTKYLNIRNNGNIGIGTTDPTAYLNIKAGTATAGTAPLKFTSGTLLGTTEAGAIEFNNDAYYGTITTGAGTAGARKQFAFTSDLTTGFIPYTGGTSNVDLGIHNLTVDTNSLFVDSVNHRVGIGTTNPTEKLNVAGNASLTGGLWVSSQQAVFEATRLLGNNSIDFRISNLNDAGGITFGIGTPNFMRIVPTTGNLILQNNGTFTDSGYRLDVTGTGRITTSLETPNIIGGTSSGGNLTLSSTSDATKGKIFFGTSAYNQLNNRLGLGTISPGGPLHVVLNSTYDFFYGIGAEPNYQVGGTFVRKSATIVNSNILGSFQFNGTLDSYASGPNVGSEIRGTADGSWTSGTSSPGRLEFFTTPASSITPTIAMTIKSTGFVGIGTTNPIYKLQVENGNAMVGGTIYANSNPIYSYTTDNYLGIYGTASSAKLFTSGSSASNISISPNDVTAMTIKVGGNVGIGTTDPTVRLQLGTLQYSAWGGISTDQLVATPQIIFGTSAYSLGNISSKSNAELNMSSVGTHNGNTFLTFSTSAGYAENERVRITNNGNVGIGTASPTANLEVAQGTAGVGTVTISGNTTATGTGTQFLNTFKVGDNIIITATGETRAISAIASNTVMTIASATNTVGSAYTLVGGTRFSVLGNGNIGIGLTNPVEHLSIRSTSSTDLFSMQANLISSRFIFNSNWNATTGDYLGLRNNGYGSTPQFIFNSSGSFGIGTTVPGSKLSVNGGISAGSYFDTPAPSNGMIISGNVGIGTTSPVSLLSVRRDMSYGITSITATNDALTAYNTNSQMRITNFGDNNALFFGVDTTVNTRKSFIQSGHPEQQYASFVGDLLLNPFGGNVGIGTTAPAVTLHVAGSIYGTTGVRGGDVSIGAFSPWSYTTANDISAVPGSSLSLQVNNGGNVGIGTTNPLKKLDVNGSSLFRSTIEIDSSAAGTQALSGDSNNLRVIGWNSTDSAYNTIATFVHGSGAAATGNVGIGTTSPIEKLDVSGSLRVSANRMTGTGSAGFLSYESGVTTLMANGSDASTVGQIQFSVRESDAGNTKDVLRINSLGYVGIGTTNPLYPLDLFSTETTGTNKILANFYSTSTDQKGSSILRIGRQSQTSGTDIESNSGYSAGTYRYGTYIDTNIVNNNTGSGAAYGNINFITGGASVGGIRMTIGGGTNAGNIGIGTTNPGARLNITDASNLQLRLSTTTNYWDMGRNVSTGDFNLVDSSGAGTALVVKTGSGNVGIGTTNPGQKLHIENGSIILATGSILNPILSRHANGGLLVTTDNTTYLGNTVFEIQKYGGSPLVTVLGSGNVGIGLTNPIAKLDVAGSPTATVNGDVLTGVNFTSTSTLGAYTGVDDVVTRITTTNAAQLGMVIKLAATPTGNAFEVRDSTNALLMRITQTGSIAVPAVYSPNGTNALNLGNGTDMRFQTNALERMRILYTNGNVGIGTTSPIANFEVAQGTAGVGTVTISGNTTATGTGTQFLNTFKVGDNIIITATGETRAISAISSNTVMTIASATNTTNSSYTLVGGTRFSVLGNGNVGVGTTSPREKLEVVGNIRTSGYVDASSYITGGWDNTVYTSSSTTLAFPSITSFIGQNGAPQDGTMSNMLLKPSNTAGIMQSAYVGAVSTTGAGTYSPSIVFGQQTGLTAYAERMRINDSGNVGIGTTAPNDKLDVNGNIRATSYYAMAGGMYGPLFGTWGWMNSDTNYTTQTGYNMLFSVGTSEKMRINSVGNLGIGTTSPTANLQVTQGTAGTGTVTVSGTAVTGVGTKFTNTFKVGDTITVTTTSGSETKAITTITSDTVLVTAAFTGTAVAGTAYTLVGGDRFVVKGNGNVGIGTASPYELLSVANNQFYVSSAGALTLKNSISLIGSDDSYPSILTNTYSNTSWNAVRYGNYRARGTASSKLAVLNGDTVMSFDSWGYDGTSNVNGATFGSSVDGTVSTGVVPMKWQWTTMDSSGVSDARLTIKSSGNVGIGTTAPATRLDVTGLTINTDATNTVMAGNFTGSITKNDANTRVFTGVNIKPSLVTGASNANTTFTVLNVDTENTTVTGLSTYLIRASYAGNPKFSLTASGTSSINSMASGTPTLALTATTLSSTGASAFSNTATFTSNTAAATLYGNKIFLINTPTTNSNILYGEHISFNDSGTLANTVTGLYVDATTGNPNDTTYAASLMGGKVGIGTTSPTEALEVVGNVLLSGSYRKISFSDDAGGIQWASGISVWADHVYFGPNDYYWSSWDGSAPARRMTIIGATGNLGIGTTSPTANLQVTQGTAGTGTVTVSGTAVTGVGTKFTNTFKVGDTITVTTTSGSETKAITTITSDTVLVTAAFTGTAAAGTAYTLVGGDRFVVKGNGNIGIGTTAPSYFMDVYNSSPSTNVTLLNIRNPNPADGANVGFNAQSDAWGLSMKAYSDAYNWKAFEDVMLGTSAPSLRIMDSHASGNIRFYTGGQETTNEQMRINSSGFVGIGTTAPGQKLDVVGNININTNGTSALFSTYKGANSDGSNIWIGGGGQSSVGVAGETYKGSNNTATGMSALQANTTGYQNVAIGSNALDANTTGSNNTASGAYALFRTTTSTNNTAVGHSALYSNTTSWQNTAVGLQSLFSNTIGNANVGYGARSLYSNSGGSFNTAIGMDALYSSVGSNNVALGYYAGRYETGSNAFYVDNQDRTNTAGDKAGALLYGVFDATPANQKLTINANVGIGTTNPGAPLHVYNTTDNVDVLRITNSIGQYALNNYTFTAPSSFLVRTGGYLLLGAAVNESIRFDVGIENEKMRINNLGSVGIGTTNPSARLSVEKATATSGTIQAADFQELYLNDHTEVAGEGPTIVFSSDYNSGVSKTIRAGIRGGTEAIGANAAGFLAFYTTRPSSENNALERMRITSGGYVGIGTTSPTANLQVTQPTTGVGTVSNAAGGTTVTGVGTQFTNTFKVGDTITINGETKAISAIASNTSMTTAAFTGANNGLYTLVGGTRLSVLGNGNVGIGTTSPNTKLEIYEGTNDRTYFRGNSITQYSSNNTQPVFELFGTGTADLVNIIDNVTPVFVIKDAGNVGIGTTNPGVKLEIANGITSTLRLTNTDNKDTTGWAGVNSHAIDFYYTDPSEAGSYAAIKIIGGPTSGSPSGGVPDTDMTFWTREYNDAMSEKMRITSTGNVGIGATNPTDLLALVQTGTTGSTLDVSRNLAAASTNSSLVNLIQDNSGDDQNVLNIQNDGTGYGLNIAQNGSGAGAFIDLGTTGTGYGLAIYSNVGATADTPLLNLNAGNVAFDQNVLNIENTGTGIGAIISQGTTGTGYGLALYSNVDATATAPLVNLNIVNAGFDQNGININNAGIGNGININQNGTGAAFNATSSTLTSGSLANYTITGTGALTGQKGINVSVSGANGTGAQTTYGAYLSNTHTGTSNNVGLYATATGGTNNYAAIFEAGNVGIGMTGPVNPLDVVGNIHSSTNLLVGAGSAGLTTSGATDIKVIDGAGNTSFRGVRATAWADSVNTGFFQIGNSSDNVAFTAQSGTRVGRLQLSATVTQIGGGAYNTIPAPITGSLFELYDNSNNPRMVVQQTGNVGIGTTGPGAKLQISGGGTDLTAAQLANVQLRLKKSVSTNNAGIWLDGSVATDSYIGTAVNSDDIIISSANHTQKEIVRFKMNGNIGIGLTNPIARLDVAGSPTATVNGDVLTGVNFTSTSTLGAYTGVDDVVARITTTNATQLGMVIKLAATPTANPFELRDSTNALLMRITETGSIAVPNIYSPNGTNALTLNNGTEMRFQTNGLERMRINYTNGNIGIGTTNPTANLQVAQGTAGVGTVTISGNTTATGTGTQFLNTFKVGDNIIITATGETRAISAIASNTVMTIASATNTVASAYTLTGGTRFSVFGNGNVGIGTTNPGSLLDINGSMNLGSIASSYNEIRMYDSTNTGGTTRLRSNAGDFSLFVNNIERLTVKNSNGNVGIGATNPNAKLQVTQGTAGFGTVTISGNTTATGTGTQFLNTFKVGDDIIITATGETRTISNIASDTVMTIASATNTVGSAYTLAGGTRFSVFGNGKVSIGTSLTSQALNVGGNINIIGDGGYLTFYNGDAQIGVLNNGTGRDLAFSTYTGSNITEKMRVNYLGNVGIGTTNPAEKLTVAKIAAANDRIGGGAIQLTTTYSGVDYATAKIVTGSVMSSASEGNLSFWTRSRGDATPSSTLVERMTIDHAGSVGIGTTNPTKKLDVTTTSNTDGIRINGNQANVSLIINNTGTSGNSWDISSTGSGNGYGDGKLNIGVGFASSFVSIDGTSGFVGIGTTAPGTMLTVGTVTTNTGNITVYGTGTTCTIGNGTGATNCTSDIRLKDNITTLETELENIMALRPVSFNWKDPTRNQIINTGLIAQEVESIYPSMVHVVYDDYLGIDYAALVVPAIKAIQEMNLKLEDLSSLDTTSPTSLGSLIKNFLADVGNGVEKIFVREIDTKNLCVSNESGEKTCITKEQLDALLAGAGGFDSGSSENSGGGGSTPPINTALPVITLDGDAEVTLNVGDTYNEAGANVTDDVDTYVAVNISGQVDTSTAGTYTLTYNAIDSEDNNAIEVTRTVIVVEVVPREESTGGENAPPTGEPSPEPAPAPEPTPDPVIEP